MTEPCPTCNKAAEWRIDESSYHALYGRIIRWLLVCDHCGVVKRTEERQAPHIKATS